MVGRIWSYMTWTVSGEEFPFARCIYPLARLFMAKFDGSYVTLNHFGGRPRRPGTGLGGKELTKLGSVPSDPRRQPSGHYSEV